MEIIPVQDRLIVGRSEISSVARNRSSTLFHSFGLLPFFRGTRSRQTHPEWPIGGGRKAQAGWRIAWAFQFKRFPEAKWVTSPTIKKLSIGQKT